MKRIIYVLSLLMVTGVYAQEKKPIDKTKQTETKTVKVKKDGKTIENKVKVTTTKEQAVVTKPKKNSEIDNNRVYPEVKVTKTISVDNDNDPFYDSKDKIVYYTNTDGKFAFSQDDKGFNIMDANKKSMGYAAKSAKNAYYILNTDNYSGVGYFNDQGDFVVEYYNAELGMLVEKEFKTDTEF